MEYLGFFIMIIVCCVLIIVSIITTRQAEQARKDAKAAKTSAEFWKQQEDEAHTSYDTYKSAATALYQEIGQLRELAQKQREQADESAKAYYNKAFDNMTLALEASAEKESEKYQKTIKEYENEYQQVMLDISKEITKKNQELDKCSNSLDDLKHKYEAAIAANKRAMESVEKKDFYRIQISETDLQEIQKIKQILPYLRDKDALNKVIYKVYYENPANDLIGRVVGKKTSGIYKITNINNEMCYVGQTVNFAERWKQHIKRGLGIELTTRNKLYPAMLAEGVENFTFEIIEECPPNKLNEREQYWQDYFGAKEFGYSIR